MNEGGHSRCCLYHVIDYGEQLLSTFNKKNTIKAIRDKAFSVPTSLLPVGLTTPLTIYDHKLVRNAAASSLMTSILSQWEVNGRMTYVKGRGGLNIENTAVDSPTKKR